MTKRNAMLLVTAALLASASAPAMAHRLLDPIAALWLHWFL
jgi:hypothetical protein